MKRNELQLFIFKYYFDISSFHKTTILSLYSTMFSSNGGLGLEWHPRLNNSKEPKTKQDGDLTVLHLTTLFPVVCRTHSKGLVTRLTLFLLARNSGSSSQ